MAGDALLSLFQIKEAPCESVKGFLTGGKGLPVRSYGEVRMNESQQLVFASRLGFIGPERQLGLGASDTAMLHRGVLYPELAGADGGVAKWSVVLLPRYRHHSDEVTTVLGICNVEDGFVIRGVRGIWAWARELVSPVSQPAGAVT